MHEDNHINYESYLDHNFFPFSGSQTFWSIVASSEEFYILRFHVAFGLDFSCGFYNIHVWDLLLSFI